MNKKIKIHFLEDLEEISGYAFQLFYKLHKNNNNRFYVIPGGETPRLFYSLLSANINNWSKTEFILSDERLSNNNFSNEFMVKKILIMGINESIKPTIYNYNRLGSQAKVEQKIKNKSPALTILGLGSDCHTASLFPGNKDILNVKDKIILKVKNSWEKFYRVSLSFNYLLKSQRIIFMITGEEKALALKKCIDSKYDPIKLPTQFILYNFINKIDILCDNVARSILND